MSVERWLMGRLTMMMMIIMIYTLIVGDCTYICIYVYILLYINAIIWKGKGVEISMLWQHAKRVRWAGEGKKAGEGEGSKRSKSRSRRSSGRKSRSSRKKNSRRSSRGSSSWVGVGVVLVAGSGQLLQGVKQLRQGQFHRFRSTVISRLSRGLCPFSLNRFYG